jgi:hypothetical protein
MFTRQSNSIAGAPRWRQQRINGARHARHESRAASAAAPTAADLYAERWLTKRQLAKHLQATPRWVEAQQRLGLPFLRMGGMNRYRASEVEAWLREHDTSIAGGA